MKAVAVGGAAVATELPSASARGWTMWALVATAYLVAFLQRLAPPTIVDRLMAEFAVGASQIGILTSAYFYGYMVMQFPAGIIVDRWGVRRAVLTSLSIAAVATLWFSHASTMAEATIARGLVALGDALVYSSLIKLVTQWFPSQRFGFMTGLSHLSGYLGGLLATTPLAVAVSALGWRGAFSAIGCLVLVELVLALGWLRDRLVGEATRRTLNESLLDAWRALGRPATWGPVLAFSGTYVGAMSLAGVWGMPMLMQAYGLSREAASMPMFVFMAGYAGGSVLFGYLTDAYFRTLRRPAVLAGLARVGLFLVLMPVVGQRLPLAALVAVLGLLGALSGGLLPLIVTSLKITFSTARIATGIGLNTALGTLGAALVQPMLGSVLERHWTGLMVEGAKLYAPEGYTWALLVLAVVSCTVIVGALLMADKEATAR